MESETIDIKSLSLNARQESFLEEYKKIAHKWGVDFQPAYRIVDLFSLPVAEQPAELEPKK